MRLWTWLGGFARCSQTEDASEDRDRSARKRLRADGGERGDEEGGNGSEEGHQEGDREHEGPDVDRSTVEVTESGEAEPADPKWDRPDLDDIPEFEVRADDPAAREHAANEATADDAEDPTAGMPNRARSPERSRIKKGGTEGYIAALELCARLPDDVRLPEEAADLVPAAVEAELEEDIAAFAAAEFDNASPHVETLAFVEADDEIWLRLRLGVPPEGFAELDPEEIRTHALQQLEGLF